jgi:hypothetical protein
MLGNNRGEVGETKEIDHESIAKQAYEEIAAEKEGREPKDLLSKPSKKEEKKSEETQDISEETPKDTDDAEEKKAESEGEGEEESQEESSEDEKPDGEETEPKVETKPTEDEDTKIQAHAEKHGMSYSEAKEDLEKTVEILKQFKNSPEEMARAIRNKDREYYKLKNEHEKATKKQEPVFKRKTDEEVFAYLKEKIPQNQKILDDYKKMFPARCELLSDEAIVEEIAAKHLEIYRKNADVKEAELKTKAENKRIELLKGIAVTDRKFLPEVKAFLSETQDETLLDDEFDMKDVLTYSKGKRYDVDVKDAYQRGLKQSKEGAEIIGVKGGSSGGSKPSGKVSAGSTLSAQQKEIATLMYGHFCDTEEDCFKMFKETFADELKKNSKFVR